MMCLNSISYEAVGHDFNAENIEMPGMMPFDEISMALAFSSFTMIATFIII